MERRIHVLPDHVANQIAAGEVVERPSSVVKELTENALDAGSTRVQIELEDGGKQLIRIVDNGCGMNEADALCALRRHATSKVRLATDLQAIATLGFRGEALPSIRSVSRFMLRTRPHDAARGVRIVADGAAEPVVEPAGGAPGTEIVVRDLFYNVPARRKFLRRTATEMSRVTTLIEQLALGWPGVHFSVVHNGRRTLSYPADADLKARLLAVLGRKTLRGLHEVRLEMGHHRVVGFTSEPSLARRSASKMFTYINGRFVRDRVIQHAVTQGYGELLQRGQYPVCVLYVTVPPEAVDVNVHPAKAEVRFVESGAIHSLVERSLRLTLAVAPWSRLDGAESNGIATPETSRAAASGALALPLFDDGTAPRLDVPSELGPSEGGLPGPRGEAPGARPPTPTEPREPAAASAAASRLLGHLQGGLLAAEIPDGLMVIDARQAHEALLCRQLNEVLETGPIAAQRLLFPVQVELGPKRAETARERSDELRWYGFDCEHFGGADFLCSSIPGVLRERPFEPALREVLDGLSKGHAVDQIVQTLARHAAVAEGEEPTEELTCRLLAEAHTTPEGVSHTLRIPYRELHERLRRP